MTNPTPDTLQVSIDFIKDAIMEIRQDIRDIKQAYATKLELAEVRKELEEKIEERTKNWNKVGSVVVIAVVGIAISAFVYLVATHPLSLIQ